MTRTLIMWSGGIDSTYCLWQALEQGRDVVAHHIVLRNVDKRHTAEQKAVDKIRPWLEDQGHTFDYVETVFDFGSLGFRTRDVYVWSFLAAMTLRGRRYRDIDSILIPRHSDAFTDRGGNQIRRSDALQLGMLRLVARSNARREFPIGKMTKADVIEAMPDGLLELTWWCRRPQRGKPCHECATCEQVDPLIGG